MGLPLERRLELLEVELKETESWQKVINYTHSDVMITGYSKKTHKWLIALSIHLLPAA